MRTSRLPLLAGGLIFGITVFGTVTELRAERDLLTLDPAAPIEDLTSADLEAVAPERLLCRNMLARVNDLVALLERSPVADERFAAELQDARNAWPGTRGRCDASIGDLEEGWPRSVLRGEFKQVVGLWTALNKVAQTHSEGAEASDVEAAIQGYQKQLDSWRTWLESSIDFWNGAWLAERVEEGCYGEARDRVQAISKKIWLLATLSPEDRSPEALQDIELRLEAERSGLPGCEPSTPLQTVDLRLLRRRLDAYGEALAGLRSNDDARIRRAMDAEQELTARSMRCRQEHDTGRPSVQCSP